MSKRIRVTAKYLGDWLQGKMDEHGIELKVKESYKTRFRGMDYEDGAARYVIRVGGDHHYSNVSVYCFIDRAELEHALNNGKKLVWRLRDHRYVQESEITYV